MRHRQPSSRGVSVNDTALSRGRPERFRGAATLTLYLSADAGITLNVTAVSAWADGSGVGNGYTQVTDTNQPAFVASSINGKPSVDFDGTDNFMSGPAPSALITVSDYTVFVVFNCDAVATDSVNTYDNDSLIGHQGAELFQVPLKATGPNVFAYNWDGSDDGVGLTFTLGASTLVMTRHNAGAIGVRVNNGAESTAASGSTTALTTGTELGRGASNKYYNGRIASVVIYNRFLPVTQQVRQAKHLGAKYGIAVS